MTIKYSMAGVPLWTNRYNGLNGNDQATAVAVDGSNNVVVTGWSDNVGGEAYATIKYSSTGVPLWTNRYGGTADYSVKAYAVAVDGSNNVIVTGFSATIKYSSTGLSLWTNVNVHANAVAVDASNNVIVTGFSGSIYDYATVKYSSAGVPLWTNATLGRGTMGLSLRRGRGRQQQRDRDGLFVWQRKLLPITRRSSIRARASRSGPTATTARGTR